MVKEKVTTLLNDTLRLFQVYDDTVLTDITSRNEIPSSCAPNIKEMGKKCAVLVLYNCILMRGFSSLSEQNRVISLKGAVCFLRYGV